MAINRKRVHMALHGGVLRHLSFGVAVGSCGSSLVDVIFNEGEGGLFGTNYVELIPAVYVTALEAATVRAAAAARAR